MKAITVDPIWAWAIIAGHKRVENRTWRTRHRGPLAIHAAATCRRPEAEAAARRHFAALGIDVPADLRRGAIVGTVDLLDVLPFDPQRFADDPLATGPWCWLLANPRRFNDPVPACGRQGLWTRRDLDVLLNFSLAICHG